jgi:uncharacterized lipoprotein YehR (DUF1307 family)
MKKSIPPVLTGLFLIIVLVLSGCKNEELQTKILQLGTENMKITNQKDSIMRQLTESRTIYDTLASSYGALNQDNEDLKARIRSLLAGIASRDKQIKAAEQEKAELNNIIAGKDVKNDSLGRVIASLNSKISEQSSSIAEAKAENKSLTDVLKVKENRIVADSLAEVKRLSQPKENGFVNIAEITGGIGFAKTHVDYSSRVIGVSNIFGYQVNRNFLTGLGVGLYSYNGGILVPLFLDTRYNFKPTAPLSPFISAEGGLQINPNDFEKTTIFINPSVGLRKKIGGKSWLNFGLGVLTIGRPDGERSSFFTIKGAVSFSGKKGPEL